MGEGLRQADPVAAPPRQNHPPLRAARSALSPSSAARDGLPRRSARSAFASSFRAFRACLFSFRGFFSSHGIVITLPSQFDFDVARRQLTGGGILTALPVFIR